MHRVAKEGDLSQGIDGPATPLTRLLQAQKTFFGGKRVGLVGDEYELHTKYNSSEVHQDERRKILPNDSKTYFEGIQVARQDDLIADGDKVGAGDGSANFSVN